MIPRSKTLFGRVGPHGRAAVLSGGMLLAFSADAPADEVLIAPLANSIGLELAPEFRAQSGALVRQRRLGLEERAARQDQYRARI
jgi:hypothetical protein